VSIIPSEYIVAVGSFAAAAFDDRQAG